MGELPGLVLGDEHGDVDAARAVRLHEPQQIERVGRVDRRLVAQRAAVEVAVGLHPGRRGPGRAPEREVRAHGERGADEGDEPLLVPRHGEVRHRGVAGGLVQRVAAHRVVAGADGRPAPVEGQALAGVEEQPQRRRARRLVEHGEGVPPLLVEGAAEGGDDLRGPRLVDGDVRALAGGRDRDRTPRERRRGRRGRV